MLSYQIYKALADEHTRDLVATAKRRELMAAHRYDTTAAIESTSHVKEFTAQLMAMLHVPRGARSHSTVTSARGSSSTQTSTPGAGPIGCSA